MRYARQREEVGISPRKPLCGVEGLPSFECAHKNFPHPLIPIRTGFSMDQLNRVAVRVWSLRNTTVRRSHEASKTRRAVSELCNAMPSMGETGPHRLGTSGFPRFGEGQSARGGRIRRCARLGQRQQAGRPAHEGSAAEQLWTKNVIARSRSWSSASFSLCAASNVASTRSSPSVRQRDTRV